jgi:hypothetical protein
MDEKELLHRLEISNNNIKLCNRIIKLYTDQWIVLQKERVRLLEEIPEAITKWVDK